MFSTHVFSIDLSAPLHALKNKEYEKSIQLYQQIETQGYQGADMYQNMAIASSAIGKDVEAIIYLEKALKYKPENQEITQLLSATLKRNSKIVLDIHYVADI
jgi:tetratricopeptide (TPR) repeat protein